MDPISVLGALFAVLVLIVTAASIRSGERVGAAARTVQLGVAALGAALTAAGALVVFFFFAVMAWGENNDLVTAMVFIGPAAVVVSGTAGTTKWVRSIGRRGEAAEATA